MTFVLDDGLEVWQLIADLEELLELDVILDNDDVAVGVLSHKLTRLRTIRRVDTSGKTTATVNACAG